MSKKTIKQRIALAAITALTAGVLSVVTSPIANAAAGDLVVELGTGAGTGVCAVTKSSGFRSTSAQIVSTLAAPVNVTVAVGGTIGYSKDTGAVSVTWPSNGVMTHATAGTLHSNYGVYSLATGGSTGISGTATQLLTAAAVGTFNVKLYDAAPFSAVNTSNASATQTGVFTVTVVASCSPSVAYSTTYSAVQVSGSYTASPSNTTADVLLYSAGAKAYINIIGKNAYDTALPGSTVWAASATNGAKVSIGTSSSISASTTTDGANSFTSTAAAGTTISVRVGAPSTAAVTTVVTVTADGAPVTTETISFEAEPSKLVLLGQAVGKISSASEGAFAFQLQDAAGNPVSGADVAAIASTYTPRVTSVTVVKQSTTVASDMSPSSETANSVDLAAIFGTSSSSTSRNGTAKFTCNSATSSGSSPITLRFTTPVTEVNVDTVVNLTCAGSVATYTISTDKAKYNVGDVMEITITAKDSAGNAPNDFVFFTANELSVGGGTPIANTATTDAFVAGVKKYKAQLTTAGAFNVVLTHAGSVTKSATAAYTVTSGDVSNAEVLKSIVALIASINKQIAALQKLILKR